MQLVNGIEETTIDARDRGFTYGDGVFRTFPMRAGTVPLWPRQYAKLAADGAALSLECPSQTILEADLAKIAAARPDGVIRITLTRGVALRGYAIPSAANMTRVVSWNAAGATRAVTDGGVHVRWCDFRLSVQPALAGIKHLNRLENVLARSEWNDAGIAEGLLRDVNGDVISGTMSNLFLLRAGELTTPALNGSGIAGVMRDLIIESARAEGVPVHINRVTPEAVRGADAVFLVNSVIGVWPVAALDAMRWSAHPFAGRMRLWIKNAERR